MSNINVKIKLQFKELEKSPSDFKILLLFLLPHYLHTADSGGLYRKSGIRWEINKMKLQRKILSFFIKIFLSLNDFHILLVYTIQADRLSTIEVA